ncbi:hypothetical protein [Marinobacter sp.]|uniref:hypothetical protein n=1 Tax=Marinobacter sp. TaxID=50741 RepID=UPI0035653746
MNAGRGMRLFAALVITSVSGCGGGGGGDSDSTAGEDPATVIHLSLSQTAVVESSGSLDGKLTLSQPQPVDQHFEVSITPVSDDVTPPRSLVIPAGEVTVGFQLQLSDNPDVNGLERYTLTATAVSDPTLADSAIIDVVDDEDLPTLTDQPAHWDQTGNFLAAADCGSCHRASEPGADPAVLRAPTTPGDPVPAPDGEDVSPITGWKSSVMANAFTDPYFRAAVAHETEQFPELAGFIEDKCLTCHSPMARTHAHKTGVGLNNDFYPMASALTDPHAREGISCSLCHQITDDILSGDVHSGDFDVDYDQAMPLIYGPYQSPVKNAMQNAIGFEPEFGLQMSDARHCASCHELFTPVIDNVTDQPTGAYFPEQAPYTEWTLSDFGPSGSNQTSCQDCHMARDDISDNFLTRLAVNRYDGSVNLSWPERGPYSPHLFLGGNTWLLETLEMFREELGRGTINEAGEFARNAERTRAFLGTAASLSASGPALSDDRLAFRITVQNRTGHKLPTSFPSRRVWLATRVMDARGTTIFESGIPDDQHRLVSDSTFTRTECLTARKPEGFDSSTCFSPHVNLVTSADQVPVYETVLQATTGDITHILLYASDALKDNRIPPAGFDNKAAPGHVAPAGIEGDEDFNAEAGGTDTISYELPLPEGLELPLTVENTLYYQSVRPTFVHAIHGDHEAISQFRTAAALNPPPAEVLSTLTFTVN